MRHMIFLTLAAASAATHAGADNDAIIETLRHFSHLPHRVEMVREHKEFGGLMTVNQLRRTQLLPLWKV